MVKRVNATPLVLFRRCDHLIIGGICFLLLFTPLAFGAVHHQVYSLMEGVVFFLIAFWMGKLVVMKWRQVSPAVQLPEHISLIRRFFLPLFLFVGLIGLQLVPLPPELLARLSPATYTLYRHSLPGWPEQSPYWEWLKQEEGETKAEIETGRHGDEGKSGVSREVSASNRCLTCTAPVGEWMPLSVAPELSRAALLQLLSYVGFFALLLLYPMSEDNTKNAERRFVRTILVIVLTSGALIATIGVIQRFFWNGKILWFFVPEQWEGALPDITPRASGPFVNSDHFANYLVLIFPLLLGGISAQRFFASRKQENAFKIFCVFALLVSFVGILLSLSRGGWIGTSLATGIFLWLLRRIPLEQRAQIFLKSGFSRLRRVVLGCGIFISITLLFIGSSGRSQIDERLEETLAVNSGLSDRLLVWQDSLGMIRDFPLLGVGLGAWPELFPHYQRPPWDPLPWREAHNDYLQCLAETGMIGIALLVWFFVAVVRRMWQRWRTVTSPHVSLVAGILAALAAMAVHEGLDFSFQIPANALLMTALVALGLRMVNAHDSAQSKKREGRWQSPLAVSVGILAVILGGMAIKQKKVAYQNDPDDFASIAEARENILAFPARSDGHVALFDLQEDSVTLPERMKELEIALWLTPLNPTIRDQYVVALLDQGQQETALKEVRQSIFDSPTLATHFYLTSEAIPQLDPPELQVIEEGLQNAWTAGHAGALTGLGEFYEHINRPLAKAQLYAQAALNERRGSRQTRYLLEAGGAYARAGEGKKAESLLRQVIQIVPQDSRAYLTLISGVFSVSGDIAAAKAAAVEGIKQGVDPSTLLLAVAGVAQKTGKLEDAKAVLQDLVQRNPSSFDGHYRLGVLYLQEKNFPRAVLTLQKAVRRQPNSADAFFMLGQAEEAQSHYRDAQKAYARALQFAADNRGFRQRYEALLKKLQTDKGIPRNSEITDSGAVKYPSYSPPKS